MVDIAAKHDLNRNRVREIYELHQERVDSERKQLLEDRQEFINKAFQDDVQNTAELVQLSTSIMKKAATRLHKMLEDDEATGDLKPSTLVRAIETAGQIFKTIQDNSITKMKEAGK